MGHIEDIAVDADQQGKKLGLRVIQALTGISENSGCYKTILNCSDHNMREFSCSFSLSVSFSVLSMGTDFLCVPDVACLAFYEKCGFEKK